MFEWIGQLIADWPIILVLPIAVVVAFIAAAPYSLLNNVWPSKKEWWQDREKRLAEKSAKAQLNKAKKG